MMSWARRVVPALAPCAAAFHWQSERPRGPVAMETAKTGLRDKEMVAINKQLQGQATKHGSGLRVPLPGKAEAGTLRIGIVRTCWHEDLIELMVGKCVQQMCAGGVLEKNIVQAVVPGSYELPYIAKRMLDSEDVDVVICVGILLKGGTIHMEVIADAVTNQLMQMQMTYNTPVIFGVLTVLAIEQAVERAESELPNSWADSALTMAMHKRKLRTDKDPEE